MIKLCLAVLFACTFEYLALQEAFGTSTWLIVILLHAIACILFSFTGYFFIPDKYKTTKISAMFLSFLLLFTLPIIGIFGVVLAIPYALCKPLKNENVEIAEHQIPELPFETRSISATPTYSMGEMKTILKYANEPNKRLTTVMAARHMTDSKAIPILKLALKDLEDDVRLLAYSTLDSKETVLNEKISILQQQISIATTPNKKSNLQQQLAHAYWELSYLGLAEGAIKTYVLEKAEALTLQSLEYDKKAANLVFLGRIYLALGKYEQALVYLTKSRELGMAERHVLPYIAEVAFYMNKFDDCKRHLDALSIQPKGSMLRHIQEYWNA